MILLELQKSYKTWYYPSPHRLDVNVSNILLFVIFAALDKESPRPTLTLQNSEAIIVPRRITWSSYTRAVDEWVVPNVTAHPSTASVPITVLLYNGPLHCCFNAAINPLLQTVDGKKVLLVSSVDFYNFFSHAFCVNTTSWTKRLWIFRAVFFTTEPSPWPIKWCK